MGFDSLFEFGFRRPVLREILHVEVRTSFSWFSPRRTELGSWLKSRVGLENAALLQIRLQRKKARTSGSGRHSRARKPCAPLQDGVQTRQRASERACMRVAGTTYGERSLYNARGFREFQECLSRPTAFVTATFKSIFPAETNPSRVTLSCPVAPRRRSRFDTVQFITPRRLKNGHNSTSTGFERFRRGN